MGWTSSFPEITVTSSADAFEMICSFEIVLKKKEFSCIRNGNFQMYDWCKEVLLHGDKKGKRRGESQDWNFLGEGLSIETFSVSFDISTFVLKSFYAKTLQQQHEQKWPNIISKTDLYIQVHMKLPMVLFTVLYF